MHVAGVASWSPLDATRIRQVNVEGTRHVLEAARVARTVRRVVVTSSVAAVGGTRRPRYLDERSEWTLRRLGIPYVTAKRDAEQLALGYAGADLEVVVVNPGFVTGPGDIYGSSSAIVGRVAKGRMPFYIEGGVSVADVRDVAHGHVAALEKGRSGERYILGGENLTMTGFVEIVSRIAGIAPPRRIPYALAWLAGRIADLRARVTGKRQPISRNLVRASSIFTFVSSRKAQEELGYRIRDVETSIADTLRFFLQSGRLRPTTAELEELKEHAG